ncbi:hypothetical protein FHU33_0537 [Blastococcus colisei]|uniref:DUF998 domain-containing protein n=1 Tax=Blastococcus colisei TaxID=1564162 RepID=A0A543PAS4_9ACTN|nr:hypothetical protein [Blastococcus colisei]TQN41177.1 hypothetical protein FHU33_0537 [Blastococcus colisei]
MDAFIRWSGLGFVASGVLVLPVAWHPDIFDTGFAAAARETLWGPGHAAGLAVVALSLLGLAGWGARLGSRAGRLGAAGAVFTVVGLVVTAGLAAVEAFVFPVLAIEEPALLDLDGPLLGSLAIRAVGGLALLWFVGLACVGVASERSGVLPRGPGWLLAVGAVSFAAFEGPFVPVLGQLSVVLFAAAQMWFGIAVAAGRTHSGPAVEPPHGERAISRP